MRVHTNIYDQIRPCTYMHVDFQIPRYIRTVYLRIRTYTCNMNIEKGIRTFLNPKKVYVFGMYLQVFCSYMVSILFVFRNIFTYCTYLHVTMRLTLFHALHTYKYVQYVHILTRIRAYTYTKYVPNTCKYIS